MNGLTPYPITPIGNFIGVVFAILPLFSQIRKFSLGIWGYSLWIALSNFQMFVNTIIWHNNVNIVTPVWCDIVTKLQVGATIGTRTGALVTCMRLYKITRLRSSSVETMKGHRCKGVIFELLMIIGFPFLVMALFIIIQPFRYNILEEEGCVFTGYTYLVYIIYYAPAFIPSLGSVFLFPIILHTFLRQRREMSQFYSSAGNRFKRLIVIACLDILINLPLFIIIIITDILQGKANAFNYPYISWKNVHDGAGELAPGLSLSSILQTPASAWDDGGWDLFKTKWNEWAFVLNAATFFGVFGTTPEMRDHYLSVLWFIPERCGYERQRSSETLAPSNIAINPNPPQEVQNRPTNNRRRASLSFLESTIGTSATTTDHTEAIAL